MPIQRNLEIGERLTRYIDRLFATVADRVADRVTDRLSGQLSELEAQVATLEVALDAEAMADLTEAEPDDEAIPYTVVRTELGLGDASHQAAG